MILRAWAVPAVLRKAAVMHLHRWQTVERIGRVVTERCRRCGRTRTRLRAAVSVFPDIPSSGHPDMPPSPPAATTGPHRNAPTPTARHRQEAP